MLLRLKAYLWAALALAGAVLGAFWMGRREGGQRAREDDYENADDIRNRVRRNLDDRVRDYDDAGWRD